MNIKIRYLLLAMFLPIILPIVVCAFWPKLIIIHYDNPDEPIELSLTQYNSVRVDKVLESGTRIFWLRTGFTRDLAFLDWNRIRDKKSFSLQGERRTTADDTLDLRICRGNIYINKDGSVQRAEWTYPVFMNLCL